MNLRHFLSVIVASLALLSCQNEMEAVVAVHDELMPKMTTISRLQEQLSESLPDSIRSEQQQAVIDELEAANDAMMDWMQDFGTAFDFEEINKGKPLTAAKQDTLKKYALSVQALKTQMLAAIANGQKAFETLKQNR